MFVTEFINNLKIMTLPNSEFQRLIDTGMKFNLDFDDAYQYSVSELFDFELVTMDKDFQRIENGKILFL